MTAPSVASSTAELPGFLEPDKTLQFQSSGGIELYGEYFDVAEPRAVAVILHGYADHCARYREVAHVAVGEGIATLSFDQRGHGRSGGRLGHVDRYTDYLDDLDAALAKLDELSPGETPRFLICHSNGSLIALRGLTDPTRRPRRVIGAVLSSPFLGMRMAVNPLKKLAGRLASRVLPTLSMPNQLRSEDLTRDPARLAAHREDPLCHKVATARWFVEAVSAQQWVLDRAHTLDLPTLWLVAGSDPIADPAASRAVFSTLRAPTTYHEFPDMLHEVFNEPNRGAAFDMLRTYVRERLADQG